MKDSVNFIALLNDLAMLEINGTDAAAFLQGQLTQDVAHLDASASKLAGYCSAKGRLLGTLVLWRSGPADSPVFRALVKTDIAEALMKRLAMYVLRAKVKLNVAYPNVMGVTIQSPSPQPLPGTPGAGALDSAKLFGTEPGTLPARPPAWTTVHLAAGVCIAAPSANNAIDRWWYIPEDPGSVAVASTDEADIAQWQAADIAAGLPWIVADTQDLFIPQTLNLDLIDGISFTKGCYPGQEVVARSHYRGTLKRRMAYGIADAAATAHNAGLAGTDIYAATRADTPCGRIINTAQVGPTLHLLLEVHLSDLDTARYALGHPNGPAIELRDLPYSIRALTAQ